MLDQLFSAKNFRRIYDSENRKGNNLAAKFFPGLDAFTIAVRAKLTELRRHRSLRSTLASAEYDSYETRLKADLAILKSEKSDAIDVLLDIVSSNVMAPGFAIRLQQKMGPGGKHIYVTERTPEVFFAMKQLQRNIQRLYQVTQSNRHDEVCKVRDTLSNSFPYEVVKTDIAQFYETIDRQSLLKQLDIDQLLSAPSLKFVRQVLLSFGTISASPKGIPRGIGISAYLAELYCRSVDKDVRALSGLVMYSRYVDDVVAVFSRPPAGNPLASYEHLIADIFVKHGLSANTAKTTSFGPNGHKPMKFEYLGYRFNKHKTELTLSPSSRKLKKYKARLEASFDCYIRERSKRPRQAFRLLISRIKFITGNSRLYNSKSMAACGVYYSNSVANRTRGFDLLDKLLKRKITALRSKTLRNRLKGLKFRRGFDERRFHRFSPRAYRLMVEAWKHV
jgi:hypothetical protein